MVQVTRMTSFVLVVILMSPVSGILTDPGPVCPGNTTTLTCNGTSRTAPAIDFLMLAYNRMNLLSIVPGPTTLPADTRASDDGTVFTVSLGINTSDLIQFQIRFVASGRNNGKTLECNVNDVGNSVTFQVVGSPSDVRQSNSTPGIGQSTVTIEWTPPPNGGIVMYTIATTPGPLSGAMPVTTSSTHITITVHYNTNYTITVAVNTCAGVQQATANILIAGCVRPPAPDNGVLLPFLATNEGAEIVYHCGPGFQPQSNFTSMCGSNALWTPDPALHNCIAVDCGDPVLPSNVTMSVVSGTTEGAIVSFQCEEGLIPSHPINITCTSTGQWMPNPQNTQCSSEVTTGRTDMASTDSSDMATSSDTTSHVATNESTLELVIPVVIVVVAATTLIGLIVIFISWRKKRGSHKKTSITNGTELQETPIMEYSTLTSRGYEADTTKDEYSTVQVKRDPIQHSQLNDEYSTIHHDRSDHKPPTIPTDDAQYSLIHPEKMAEAPSGSQGLVYADLGGPRQSKAQPSFPIPEDRVVYSDINTSATAKLQKQKVNPDASLDLNMMLIQVREVIPSWYLYGEALGVSEEMLKEVHGMKMDDYDKLVEVLDCWFRSFPKNKPPTWRDVALGLQNVGFNKLSADIMKVYTTGHLPIAVSEEVPRHAYGAESHSPPPLPPKLDDSEDAGAALMPPRPKPRVGSLKNAPPRPPKIDMPQSSAPARPPKSSLGQARAAVPARPPKPGNE